MVDRTIRMQEKIRVRSHRILKMVQSRIKTKVVYHSQAD